MEESGGLNPLNVWFRVPPPVPFLYNGINNMTELDFDVGQEWIGYTDGLIANLPFELRALGFGG